MRIQLSHALQWIIRFLHVFVYITVANAAVSEGKSGVVVFVGPCPFSVLFCCFGDETQVWLGDLRVVLLRGGDGCCDLICLIGTGQLRFCTSFLTAYVSFRTVPQCIYGQSRGKKIEWDAFFSRQELG